MGTKPTYKLSSALVPGFALFLFCFFVSKRPVWWVRRRGPRPGGRAPVRGAAPRSKIIRGVAHLMASDSLTPVCVRIALEVIGLSE